MIKRIFSSDKQINPSRDSRGSAVSANYLLDVPLAVLEQCKDTVGWIIVFLKTTVEGNPATLESISELLQTLQTISILLSKIISFIFVNGMYIRDIGS